MLYGVVIEAASDSDVAVPCGTAAVGADCVEDWLKVVVAVDDAVSDLLLLAGAHSDPASLCVYSDADVGSALVVDFGSTVFESSQKAVQ